MIPLFDGVVAVSSKLTVPSKVRFRSFREYFREMLRASLNFKTRRRLLKQFEVFNAQRVAFLDSKLLNITRKKTSYDTVEINAPSNGFERDRDPKDSLSEKSGCYQRINIPIL
jgi:hypothetical protein